MGDRIPSGQWIPSGNDFVIDGLWGRLGFQETVGETRISGATNGLAAVEDPANGNTYLYAGAANGGLYLRTYDSAKGQWRKKWQWLSKPGSSYTGSQGIGILEVSPNNQYLAVGQGNPSNYAGVSAPSRGIQLGRVLPDGTLSWLPQSDSVQSKLNGLDVRSLVWEGNLLRGTGWDIATNVGSRFSLLIEDGNIVNVEIQDVGPLNLVSDGAKEDYFEAGYNDQTGLNQISLNGSPITGSLSQELIESYTVDRIARISVYPELVNGNYIVFLGSFLSLPTYDEQPIVRIVRAEINPVSGELISYQSTTAANAEETELTAVFGTNQGSNNELYYGNFSFQADPYDPDAQSIYIGGNQYSDSKLAPTVAYTGGLVKADFRTPEPTLTPLYGPRVDGSGDTKTFPFAPGAPHADSRTIVFFNSDQGVKLVQTDDGGVWELPQRTTATGLKTRSESYWSSLAAPGMATLELNQVDWNSVHNLILSSYQDNSSSTGIYGQTFASNIGVGDGQLALFDDADSGDVRGYIASQLYYKAGRVISSNYDKNGFVKSITYPEFFLQDSASQRLISWEETPEASYKPGKFVVPVDTNPYRPASLVQTGYTNVYEQVDAGEFGDVALVFRPLLPEASTRQLTPTALDTQSPVSRDLLSSIYVGGYARNGDVTLLGRSSGPNLNDYQLQPLRFNNTSLQPYGQVVDVTHRPGQGSDDLLFWLQGGTSLAYGLFESTVPSSQQVLRFGRAGGSVTTLSLEEIGLPLIPGDQYGYQALQYVPQSDSHPQLLLISGLNGVWSSELSDEGVPLGFSPMPWRELPDSGPGAYIRSLKYDPTDDLLIAASQGKGSYLYSFAGDIGKRTPDNKILNVSDLTLPLLSDPQLDKRGNEVNALISVSLEGQLLDPQKMSEITVKLHDVAAWRRAMEFVTPYNFNVNPSFNGKGNQAAQLIFNTVNVLDPIGLRKLGGQSRLGNLSFPIEIAAGATLFNLQVNPKDREVLRAIDPLKYTVKLAGTNERVARTLAFEFLPLSQLDSQDASRALMPPDEITGYGLGNSAVSANPQISDNSFNPLNEAVGPMSDLGAVGFSEAPALGNSGPRDQGYPPMLLNDSNLFL